LADIWCTEAGERESEAETEWMNRFGFATESLDAAELRRRDPAWGHDVRGAVIHRDGMRIDPAALCDAMRSRIGSLGGVIRTGCAVEAIRPRSDGWEAVLAGGEVLAGGRLVLSAGVWSEPLARMMGVHIPMQPAKGYHRMVRMEAAPTIAAVLREPKIGTTPMGSLLRVAGTLELSGFNHRLDPGRIRQLMAGTRAFLPAISAAEPVDLWCGLRPCTARGLPVIGRGARGAWIAAGHGMMGVTLAPGTAKLIADDMLGEPVPDWSEMLRPSR
jgi:D-amino-acid dehydrogenase